MEFNPRRWTPFRLLAVATALFLLEGAWISLGMREHANETIWEALLVATVSVQLGFAVRAVHLRILQNRTAPPRSIGAIIGGIIVGAASVVSGLYGLLMISISHLNFFNADFGGIFTGGAWGRPLRIRGRQLHPQLRRGADWTLGNRPDPTELDDATRAALEGLWLHDAQKEHASVPAFARVTWLLAAAGGPAELMTWAHRAGIEEIEHAQACFALAAGYGGRCHTVEPMPELLLGGLDARVDPRVTLAIESLSDGCQLEDFNADVAAACAEVCQEPATRQVLETIAHEERSHAELSWAILHWLVEHHREVVERPLRHADCQLDSYPRPTAVANDRRGLVERADPAALLAHGRLPDEVWQACWNARLIATRARLATLLTRASTQVEPQLPLHRNLQGKRPFRVSL